MRLLTSTPTTPELRSLKQLDISFNNLVDLSLIGLQSLVCLEVLRVSGNDLSSLYGLGSCQNLQELIADKNRIKDLDFAQLSACMKLKTLSVRESGIRSISNVTPESSCELTTLLVNGNRIGTFQEMEKLGFLQSLDELGLDKQMISRKQWYRQKVIRRLPNLMKLDDKDITEEEWQRTFPNYEQEEMEMNMAVEIENGQRVNNGNSKIRFTAAPRPAAVSALPGNTSLSSHLTRQLGSRSVRHSISIPSEAGNGLSYASSQRRIQGRHAPIQTYSTNKALPRRHKEWYE